MAIVSSSKEIVQNQEVFVLIEVDKEPSKRDLYGETRSIKPQDVIETAKDIFDDGIALARVCAQKAVTGIRQLDETFRPEEFELKLAIKLDSELGAVIAKASTGAQLEVTMTWKPRD